MAALPPAKVKADRLRRVGLIALLALTATACAGSPPPEPRPVPYANAPGSIYAPLRTPAPSPRGIAPTVLNVPGLSNPASSRDVASGKVGVMCGDPRLLGRQIARIDGAGACGIDQPVRINSVAGVQLKNAVRVNCKAARAFADWTEKTAKPSAEVMGALLTHMRPVASYACRARNNQRGARLSEHAKGNAIDIADFTFSDGKTVSVLKGWRGEGSTYLRRVWKGACGTFGTVLGPESDRFHQDHFHFDVAKHRGGPYCR